MSEGASRAVFLDRDGTLVEERDYLADPDQVVLVPGVVGALAALSAAGFALVVVTNQSGIARGLYREEDYHRVAARLAGLLAEEGVSLDATFHCPHHPEHTGPCACRKPGLGMYRQAAAQLGVALDRSFYVGDKPSDVLPGLALGGTPILVRTGYGRRSERSIPAGVLVADDLAGAAHHILGGREKGGAGDAG